jgi:Transposase IS4
VGTLKKNKPEVPPAFKLASRDIHSSLFGFSGLLTMASYIPKKGKNVLMLSSMHHSSEIDQNSAKRKPEIILYYNKSKGGVDAMDQKLGNYTCRRQTKRWPVVLLYNMLDVATLNGFIIFTDHNPTRFGNHLDVKRLFLSELAVQLTRPHMIER